MSAPEEYRGPNFVGIMGHDNVSHNGSKTTVYFVQVQVPEGGMFIVRHRYHEFKDFYDKVRMMLACHVETCSVRFTVVWWLLLF